MLNRLIRTLRKRGAQGRVFPVQPAEAAQAAELIADVVAQRDALLQALETLVEHFEYYMGDNECRPLENARAAIAKAEGEQP